MTQMELFSNRQVGNLTFEEPTRPVVVRIAFGPHPLPDMRGQPPAVNRPNSIQAADNIKPLVPSKKEQVFEFIASKNGVSDNRIIEHFRALGWNGNTPRARRVELMQDGRIESAGDWHYTSKGKTYAMSTWVRT